MHPPDSRKMLLIAWLILTAGAVARADDAPTIRGRLSFEYSSNPERTAAPSEAGWALRSYVRSTATLFRRDRTHTRLQYQGGVRRRFGGNARRGGRPGATVLNDLECHLHRAVSRAVSIGLNGRLKNKSVTRMPWENGYLQESCRVVLNGNGPLGMVGDVSYALGTEAPEDSARAGFSTAEWKVRISRSVTERCRSYLQFASKVLTFDRRAEILVQRPFASWVETTDRDREDRLRQVDAGLRLYKWGLFSLTYAYQNNRTNSYGYAFHAHRIVLLSTSTVPFDALLQIYGLFQIREYTETVPGLSPESEEEYEHTVLTLRISRTIAEPYEIELQYGLRRSGRRDADTRYTEHVWALSLNLIL